MVYRKMGQQIFIKKVRNKMMLRFGERKVSKERTRTNSNHFIGYVDEVMRPLVLVLPKTSGYVKIFKVKYGDKYKNKKFMSMLVDVEKLLENYKTILAKIEDLKNIELNTLHIFDDRYIKAKIRTYAMISS